MKKVLGVYHPPEKHWVGDGFPVRSLFSYQTHGQSMSPFLLLDYAGPEYFPPAKSPRGVGQHPHRGFETVTIVYQGEVEHRDSTGKGGVIGAGDVQWMTAGGGILHDEFHSSAFTQSGGMLEMVQLWVNLPAAHKMTAPGYQSIVSSAIPVVELPNGAGSMRIIAGSAGNVTGPAHTFSPMNVWDLSLRQGGVTELSQPAGWNTSLIVLKGQVCINDEVTASDAQLIVLDAQGDMLTLEASTDAIVVLLAGEPIREPIAGYGPFVMNSKSEIVQAFADVNAGKFGQMND